MDSLFDLFLLGTISFVATAVVVFLIVRRSG
jgi:hypothetical protein